MHVSLCCVYCFFVNPSTSLSLSLSPSLPLSPSPSPSPSLPLSPSQQYYDRSGKQKEEYQAFLESRKSETPPSGGENAADTQSQSDQVQNTTEEPSATKQTVQVEATATQQGLADVLNSDQMQKPPTPLQPKLVVGSP